MTTSASTTSIVTVNGIELGYQVFGDGAPLVLLHGGFGSTEMFGPNITLLAEHRQVVAVDLQSHRRSPAADRPMRTNKSRPIRTTGQPSSSRSPRS